MRLAQLTLAWGRVPFSLGMLWVREWVLGGALEYRDLAIWEQDCMTYVWRTAFCLTWCLNCQRSVSVWLFSRLEWRGSMTFWYCREWEETPSSKTKIFDQSEFILLQGQMTGQCKTLKQCMFTLACHGPSLFVGNLARSWKISNVSTVSLVILVMLNVFAWIL